MKSWQSFLLTAFFIGALAWALGMLSLSLLIKGAISWLFSPR